MFLISTSSFQQCSLWFLSYIALHIISIYPKIMLFLEVHSKTYGPLALSFGICDKILYVQSIHYQQHVVRLLLLPKSTYMAFGAEIQLTIVLIMDHRNNMTRLLSHTYIYSSSLFLSERIVETYCDILVLK